MNECCHHIVFIRSNLFSKICNGKNIFIKCSNYENGWADVHLSLYSPKLSK